MEEPHLLFHYYAYELSRLNFLLYVVPAPEWLEMEPPQSLACCHLHQPVGQLQLQLQLQLHRPKLDANATSDIPHAVAGKLVR